MKNYLALVAAGLLTASPQSEADVYDHMQQCLLLKMSNEANDDKTAKQIKQECRDELDIPKVKLGGISKRMIRERVTEADPFVITPHLMNYIMPVSWSSNINRDAYEFFGDVGANYAEQMSQMEAKFQLSLKAPLAHNIFSDYDSLYFAFTTQSWWQVYSDGISKPFRETNYKPEIFYMTPLDFHPLENANTGLVVGFEHQSNGQNQLLSRSWNRVYATLMMERDDLVIAIKPWWRLPEDDKTDPLDPKGDDNPDIDEYLGHFEFYTANKWDSCLFTSKDCIFSSMFRYSFEGGRGAMELGLTFPLWGSEKLRGYIQYFNGYGESLIDYNHSQQRISFGIALTDLL